MTLGDLLITCSLIYAISKIAAYQIGDNFIMDKIDEMICSEQLLDTFVNDSELADNKGFTAYGRRPADPDFRQKVYDSFFTNEDEFEDFR